MGEWVNCPICNESDMELVREEHEGLPLIRCVNHGCPSNIPLEALQPPEQIKSTCERCTFGNMDNRRPRKCMSCGAVEEVDYSGLEEMLAAAHKKLNEPRQIDVNDIDVAGIDSLKKPVDAGCTHCLHDANIYNNAIDDVKKLMEQKP